MLGPHADRDPEPAVNRVQIVMADEDPALAKLIRDRGGRVTERRLDEDEVRL